MASIGNSAFYGCECLETIYLKSTVPPVLGSDTFGLFNKSIDRTFLVPAGYVDDYKNAEGWSEYADQLVGYDYENGVVVEE